jgi:prepilin-type N-terminal cleavage/methylation domain-containing protein
MPLVTRHTSHVTGRRPAAFTLIELLIVISIILILAGLAFPAVQGALESAKKAQARNDVHQIAAAVRAFHLEYGRYPTSEVNTGGDGGDFYTQANNNSVIRALMGQDADLNPRNIVFLDAKTAKAKKGGVDISDYIFYDPWGTPYGIKMDNNYNGRTEYYGQRLTPVVVVSFGPNKEQDNPNQSNDDITNF